MKRATQLPIGSLSHIGLKRILLLLLLTLSVQATNISQYVTGQSLAITTTSNTPVKVQLSGATMVQMYIDPSSTAQLFTVTLPNGTTIAVPSGGTLTLRFAANLLATDQIGTVVSGTGSCNLQVISLKEIKQ